MDDKTQVGRLLIAANARYPDIKTKADLCRHLGLPQQIITNWNSRGIPVERLDSLCEEFHCSKKWLKSNEGTMKDGIIDDTISARLLKLNAKASLLDDEDFERVLRFCDDLDRSKGK